ncbi:hypothetical protein Q9L58_005856 [Maublancomyces gigas]|uniref:Rhodopsin domain-containing protein n=1 Tax=Discina gigas TaxID=1032678 RepID=A0ABR3GH11_9PEZI
MSVATRVGFGMHGSSIRPEWRPEYSMLAYAATGIANIPFALNKLSMLHFYLHLVPNPNFRRICHISIAYLIIIYTSITLINWFGCSPISAAWKHDPSIPSTCITKNTYHYVNAVNNTITDILLLVLPIPVLLQLRLSMRAKLGLIVMFSMGFVYVPYSLSLSRVPMTPAHSAALPE